MCKLGVVPNTLARVIPIDEHQIHPSVITHESLGVHVVRVSSPLIAPPFRSQAALIPIQTGGSS